MSRSGYVDVDDLDACDQGSQNLWRGTVMRAFRGKRGQAFLIEMHAALDAMPAKRLIAKEIVNDRGEACAIGVVALSRGIDVSNLDSTDGDAVGAAFGVAQSLAREIEYMNDEAGYTTETPEERWRRMRAWVAAQIKVTP
jgi:hypothetical protein